MAERLACFEQLERELRSAVSAGELPSVSPDAFDEARVRFEDGDNDGWTEQEGDCGPDDPSRYPGAVELCDGVGRWCAANRYGWQAWDRAHTSLEHQAGTSGPIWMVSMPPLTLAGRSLVRSQYVHSSFWAR